MRGDNVRRGGTSDGSGYRRGGYVATVLFKGCFMQPSTDRSGRPIPATLFLSSGALLRCARPGDRLDLVGAEGLGALRDDRGDDRLLVDLAALQARRLFAQVVIAPLSKRGERDVQVETLLRQLVLVPLRALAVEDPLEHALVDQPVEPVGQNVAGDSQALLQLIEAMQAEQDVTDDQQRPALADNLERPRDRTVLAFVVTVQHRRQL